MVKSKARKPMREQKKWISAAGLVVKNWLVLSDTPEEIKLVNRGSGRIRTIKKTG